MANLLKELTEYGVAANWAQNRLAAAFTAPTLAIC
jgi:hypothetical protein